MLNLIRVRNYTVIDEVELDLGTGFSVITGETGAGKSILVDALGLALGDRADASAVRAGTDRAEISVEFACTPAEAAHQWLVERSLDQDDGCILRRVVTAEGRSRAFINGTPATLQDLRELGSLLVDIHGQHAHQSLLQPATQRLILDTNGGHAALAQRTAETYREWAALAARLERQHENEAGRSAEVEWLRHQVRELEQLGLAEGEIDLLTTERERLANVDRLAGGLTAALTALYEADGGSAHTLLAQAQREIEALAAIDGELTGAVQLLRDAEIAIREAVSTLVRYRDRIEHDPQRLDWIESRLSRTRELARRHGVADRDLHTLLPQLLRRIDQIHGANESLEELRHRVERAESDFRTQAEALSAARVKCAGTLAEQVTTQLRELGLPHATFRVTIERREDSRADAGGLDRIDFQVQLNPGQPFGSLGRMASGGELSRISLALEVVAAGASGVPTLVFDEVDAGIGGGVAEIVGARLASLANQRQVLCVTHLPQVASQGHHHFRVVKQTDGNSSRTGIGRLEHSARVDELSRMLGGVEITARARAHAEEMIQRSQR